MSANVAQGVITVNVASQRLYLEGGEGGREYPVSTATNGVGEQQGSGCTPRGRHTIRAMIGANAPLGTVYVGRRSRGEIYSPELALRYPERDWILSRILWLSGLEPGRNRLGGVDTMRRYIYIHGTSDEAGLGRPISHGCVRMGNSDIMDLFGRVTVGTPVNIVEE